MPTIDEELIQNAKAVFNSEVIINSANDLKTKDGSSIGGSSEDQANWLNYHVEFKAGGPISIRPSIEDNGLFLGSYGTGSSSGIYKIYYYTNKEKEKITSPRSFYNTNAVNSSLFNNKRFAIDTKDNNKIIEINDFLSVSSSNPNVYLRYTSEYNYPYFGISNIDALENGDYTLNYVYALGTGDGDYSTLKITSEKNVGKIHMVVEDNTIEPSSSQYRHQLRAADGETGLLYQYLEGVDNTFFLISVQLVKGWTE